ncbi:branched-chain amino acid ABC transporter permease [Paenalcaligenes hominis]|uniref:branched-chain amino acid ABC transporter permease n=1 Tax=Paenalcaligenes hominis TaxID=643674 RepID=UPI0035244254
MESNTSKNYIFSALVIGCAFLFPLYANSYYTGLALEIIIYAIFALGLQLLVGGAGLVSLGHAAFFGLAAYTTVLVAPEMGPANLFVVLFASVVVTGIFALVTGALVLRTTGIYFIMVTLAFAQMAYFIFHDTNLGGGSDGAYLYFRPEARLGDTVLFSIGNNLHFFYFSLICLIIVWFSLYLVMRSRFGAALTGIRLNEQRMRSAGFPTYAYKLVAYVMSGVIASLSGLLYVVKDGYVNPEILSWEQSGLVLLMVILGGQFRLWGAIVGAAALILLQELFQSHEIFGNFASHWNLSYGLAIMALVAFLPEGIAGIKVRFTKNKITRLSEAQDSI